MRGHVRNAVFYNYKLSAAVDEVQHFFMLVAHHIRNSYFDASVVFFSMDLIDIAISMYTP